MTRTFLCTAACLALALGCTPQPLGPTAGQRFPFAFFSQKPMQLAALLGLTKEGR